MKSRMMEVLTFRATDQRDQAEERALVQGNSSMVGKNALEGGYVEYAGQRNLL